MGVIATGIAWDAIGWDDGNFRIKGGRTTYNAVIYNCETGGRMVKLSKLVAGPHGLQQVNRYVDPDTQLEFLEQLSTSKSLFDRLEWQ